MSVIPFIFKVLKMGKTLRGFHFIPNPESHLLCLQSFQVGITTGKRRLRVSEDSG